MTTQEKRAAIEKNYRIMDAALAVQEAWEAYRKAEDEHEIAFHKWFEMDRTADNAFAYHEAAAENHRTLAIESQKEGLFKKAVNRYYKAIGRDPKKWEYAREAQRDFNEAIRESEVYHNRRTPLENISLYQFIIV